jgi:hypothetical protein
MLQGLIGDADLAVSRLVQRKPNEDGLGLGRSAVLQDRLSPRQFLQRQFAACVIELLEAIETVAAVAHHLAGLADVAELLGQLEQPYLGANDLLFLGHGLASHRIAEAGRGAGRDCAAPGLGSCLSYDTDCRIKS